MARINNLTNFLTDVASAIKTKTGDSTAIPASQFDTKIANITTGHLDNTEYAEANDDLDDILEGSSPVTIYPPDWNKLGYEDTPQSIIDGFNYAKDIKDNWNSNITNLSYIYNNNKSVLFFPLVDTSKVTSMSGAFSYSVLQHIEKIDTSKVTNMSQTFDSCYSLIDVPAFEIPAMTSSNSMYNCFHNCNFLSNDSLNNIMATCISATNYSGTKTLRNIGLTSAQCTTCQGLSNYQDFLAARWTTGY